MFKLFYNTNTANSTIIIVVSSWKTKT